MTKNILQLMERKRLTKNSPNEYKNNKVLRKMIEEAKENVI